LDNILCEIETYMGVLFGDMISVIGRLFLSLDNHQKKNNQPNFDK